MDLPSLLDFEFLRDRTIFYSFLYAQQLVGHLPHVDPKMFCEIESTLPGGLLASNYTKVDITNVTLS